jgi:hypothetical protein
MPCCECRACHAVPCTALALPRCTCATPHHGTQHNMMPRHATQCHTASCSASPHPISALHAASQVVRALPMDDAKRQALRREMDNARAAYRTGEDGTLQSPSPRHHHHHAHELTPTHPVLAALALAAAVDGAGPGAVVEGVGGAEDADEQAREDAREDAHEDAVSGPHVCPSCITAPTTPVHARLLTGHAANAHRVLSQLPAGCQAA